MVNMAVFSVEGSATHPGERPWAALVSCTSAPFRSSGCRPGGQPVRRGACARGRRCQKHLRSADVSGIVADLSLVPRDLQGQRGRGSWTTWVGACSTVCDSREREKSVPRIACLARPKVVASWWKQDVARFGPTHRCILELCQTGSSTARDHASIRDRDAHRLERLNTRVRDACRIALKNGCQLPANLTYSPTRFGG